MSDQHLQQPFLQQPFLETADLLYQSADRLASQLHYAAQAITHTLTAGGKVLCAGQAEAHGLARQAAQWLVHGTSDRPRPPLAALALAQDPSDLVAQVRALGHPGDIWLAFSLERDEPGLAAATEAAREQDLTIVAFTGETALVLGPMLRDTDVWVPIPGAQPSRLMSVAWLALHGLCEAVDTQLLGEVA
ncbi:SIS domain-containing protein [Aquabacterium sp.]|uniref:SIS domain-containing protein n=1 Tax=Aquabacterium sp. TaxID=1872578 RepID=UPI0035B1255D